MARRNNTNRTRGSNEETGSFSSFGSASSRSDLSGEFRAEDSHGQNQQLNTAAQGLSPGNSPGSTNPASGQASNPAASILGPNTDPFRGTDRPNEPLTSGAQLGAGDAPEQFLPGDDVDIMLQAIADKYGDPVLRGLIKGIG